METEFVTVAYISVTSNEDVFLWWVKIYKKTQKIVIL